MIIGSVIYSRVYNLMQHLILFTVLKCGQNSSKVTDLALSEVLLRKEKTESYYN